MTATSNRRIGPPVSTMNQGSAFMGGGSLLIGNRFLLADQGHKDSKHYEEENL